MNISWQWLGELVDLKSVTPKQLSDKLTLAGFEIDNLDIEREKEPVLDISITANREDASNITGIAKEISSLYKTRMVVSNTQLNLRLIKKVFVSDQAQYTHQLTSIIDGIQVKTSPLWLQKKLSTYKIDNTNNINDIIHLINLKWSQHLRVFDLDKIKKQLNCETISLDEITTLFQIPDRLDNVKAEITGQTQSIFLHMGIPKSSLRHRLYQELKVHPNIRSVYKKENNSRISTITDSYVEAIMLITKLSETNQYSEIIYTSNPKQIKRPIKFKHEEITTILGPLKNHDELNLYNTYDIIHNLHFIYHSDSVQLYLDIPGHRKQDIERSIDVLEEISRIYGFDNFSDSLPRHKTKINHHKGHSKNRIKQIRNICRCIGLHETVHSSLGYKYETKIYNPLTADYNSLRDSLLPGLIKSNIYNIKHNQQSIEVFEIGKIFQKDRNNSCYKEMNHIAGILGGNLQLRKNWSERPTSISWFQAKGDMEEFFERLDTTITWKTANQKNIHFVNQLLKQEFYPKRSSIIYRHDKPIGIFGEIKFDKEVQKISEPVYGFEISIDNLTSTDNTYEKLFHPYTRYPSIVRDIKIEIPATMEIEDVIQKLNNINETYIESIKLFDVYKQNTNSSLKSLGFRITCTSFEGTLTNEKVNTIEEKVKLYLSR
uniref:phenylalanine--tRNA ligase n=1 Tax=Dermonema virens TaxID=1077399 RepID=A0A1G4NS02_9FLOR|nr:Phenylalanine-tRNA ligase beta subunit [Dermonema virens]SCW21438.1 Phenylalanine-tRNA ligase beta subunit [Dermonema virens]